MTIKNTTASNPPLDNLVDEREAANFLSISHRTLQQWRWRGEGPAYIKLGGTAVRYRLSDLQNFIASSARILRNEE